MSSLKNSLCQNTKNELRECLLVISKKTLRRPGIEPGSQEWESCMIPLHQRRRYVINMKKPDPELDRDYEYEVE